jgi:hypothetical protein
VRTSSNLGPFFGFRMQKDAVVKVVPTSTETTGHLLVPLHAARAEGESDILARRVETKGQANLS